MKTSRLKSFLEKLLVFIAWNFTNKGFFHGYFPKNSTKFSVKLFYGASVNRGFSKTYPILQIL